MEAERNYNDEKDFLASLSACCHHAGVQFFGKYCPHQRRSHRCNDSHSGGASYDHTRNLHLADTGDPGACSIERDHTGCPGSQPRCMRYPQLLKRTRGNALFACLVTSLECTHRPVSRLQKPAGRDLHSRQYGSEHTLQPSRCLSVGCTASAPLRILPLCSIGSRWRGAPIDRDRCPGHFGEPRKQPGSVKKQTPDRAPVFSSPAARRRLVVSAPSALGNAVPNQATRSSVGPTLAYVTA